MEPCHKLPGPGAQKGLRPTSPISDSAGVLIHSDEAMILQYGYSDEYHANFSVEPSLFRVLASQFSRAIQSPSLRYAVLACVAEWISGERSKEYLATARRTLGKKLLDPRSVEEADLFAAYLLCLYQPYGTPQSTRHLHGCLAIYNFLLRKYSTPSPVLKVYGPFVLDQVVDWLSLERLAASPSAVSWDMTNLECLSLDRKLKHAALFSSPKWPTVDIAAFTTLAGQVHILRCLIVRTLDRQAHNGFEPDLRIAWAVKGVRTQFYTENLRKFVDVAEEICDEALRKSRLKDYVLLAAITCYSLCIRIQICLLEYHSVLAGLQSAEAQHYASKVAAYLEVFGVGMPIYVSPVLFTGLAIPGGEYSKRIVPHT